MTLGTPNPSLTLGNGTGGPQMFLNKTATAQNLFITGQTAGIARWRINLGNSAAESGGNAGSDFTIANFSDAGASLSAGGWAMQIQRSSGICTFQYPIVNGVSDRTMKENIAPLEGALDKVLALQGVSFNMIATPDKREIGLIAQDVAPIVPEIIQTFPSTGDGPKLALDYPKLVALLIESVKALRAEIVQLRADAGLA
jgi:hypothetical protein